MFKDLKIEDIIPNPEQPRKYFDEAKEKELTVSIKENGLLQPVVVRPVEGAEAPYMLIAGERRWRSCKAAGLGVVPAKVVEGANDVEAYVLSIAENVNRADMTIMEEAGAYADLVAGGWKEAKIAKQFGKTETHIKWRLGLLTLCKQVSEWVNEKKILPNLAWHIAQLSPGNQLVAATRYLRGDFESEAAAQHFANGLKMMEAQTSLTGEKAPDAEEQEKRKKAKAKAKDGLGKAEEVLLPLLEELAQKKPEDLAVILGEDLDRHIKVVGRIFSQTQMVRNLLSKAQGIQRAMEAEFNKAAEGKAQAAKQVAKKPAAKPAAPRARASKAAARPATTTVQKVTAEGAKTVEKIQAPSEE